MNIILVKVLATALAFSQATTRPDAIKSEFDPATDKVEVEQLLQAGCLHMRRSFDIEQINLDDLIATAMDDKGALGDEIKALKGLSLTDLHTVYRQYCKGETVRNPPVDLTEVIAFYNEALKDLPDVDRLKGMKLPGMSVILDGKGERFAEVFTAENRRVWVSISDIPEQVRNAFIAAEDKRFRQHSGVDERGLVRAFVGNLAQPGRPQGGSTITQQLAKTVLVGNDVTYERKLREIIVASKIERALSKDEILELYLNSIYLGRGAWGVEMAARGYFGKSVRDLTAVEAAFIAGLAKGPSYFSPDRNATRARERLAYVLGRMRDDGMIDSADAKVQLPRMISYERLRPDTGYHFIDHVSREARSLPGIGALNESSYVVRSTINLQLQRATESVLQEALARYELNTGRYKFQGAEANISDALKTMTDERRGDAPAWLAALRSVRLPLYDVHWQPAVVLENGRTKRGDVTTVGLMDGRTLPLNPWSAAVRRNLEVNDVVYVRVREAAGKQAARAELRIRPNVQGSALVMENKTGRILAMTGGFSYPESQLNRAVQSVRQPGSTLKPVTYLAALRNGLQPNTLVMDSPIVLPPIGQSGHARPKDYWAPRGGSSGGAVTLRRGLEDSRNLATAQLMAHGVESSAEQGLDRICELAVEAQLYKQCDRFYPFILGAQPLRMVDLAAFYAAIANEGARPTPHVIDSIEQDGREIYKSDDNSANWIGSVDRAAFFQLKSMLQGVLARGTARSVKHLSAYAAGKTGTTDNELDAWFVGFTNDVTIALWVGYDNAGGSRRTLGHGQAGARVALPMFEPILEAVWRLHAPKVALNGPSQDALRQLVAVRTDPYTGDPNSYDAQRGGSVEYLRRDTAGGIADTRYRIVSRGDNYYYSRGGGYEEDGGRAQPWPYDNRYGFRDFFQQQPGYYSGYYYGQRVQPRTPEFPDDDYYRRPRRVDPDYFLWPQTLLSGGA